MSSSSFKKIVWLTSSTYIIEYVAAWVQLLRKAGIIVEIIYDAPKYYHHDVLYIISKLISTFDLPQNYIVFQKEQISSGFFRNEEYISMLKGALLVLEYSPTNRKYLVEKLGISKVHDFPFSYCPMLEISSSLRVVQDIDILFMGVINDRRRIQLNHLKRRGFSLVVANNIFGVEKEKLVKRAKIVLNIHHYENPSILETERIGYLLANRKCVISERSSEIEVDKKYEKAVVFYGGIEELEERCKDYLAFSERRFQQEKRGYKHFLNFKVCLDPITNLYFK